MWSNTDSNFLFPQDQPLATDMIIMFIYKLSEQSILTSCSTVNEDPATDIRVKPFQTPFQVHPELCHFSDFFPLLCRDNMPYANLPKQGCQICFLFSLVPSFYQYFFTLQSQQVDFIQSKTVVQIKIEICVKMECGGIQGEYFQISTSSILQNSVNMELFTCLDILTYLVQKAILHAIKKKQKHQTSHKRFISNGILPAKHSRAMVAQSLQE